MPETQEKVGWRVGLLVGDDVGLEVGSSVGALVGELVGVSVGECVGSFVGLAVGASVHPIDEYGSPTSDSSTQAHVPSAVASPGVSCAPGPQEVRRDLHGERSGTSEKTRPRTESTLYHLLVYKR